MDEYIVPITITISQEEEQALIKLANRQRRDPKDQAAMMIRRELEEYGLMPWRPGSDDDPQRTRGVWLDALATRQR
jgi:hypothetical protein